ncbi:hypothetical protein DB30_00153 [Enhygromyxa salina]|uniref:Uncharacterized protein n=1 Tax=Enhygromyxa salina TaxID=215803 RepID=A0A0C1ZPX1_9BACT|nr:hypothetical protein DB30_00153 [Enhygromyxa salina]
MSLANSAQFNVGSIWPEANWNSPDGDPHAGVLSRRLRSHQ